jgi:putative transposase
MRRRWTADQITRLLKDADRDLAKKLTVSDICRKHGISQSMYYRWRDKRDPKKVDGDRQHREMEIENDRLRSWSPSCSWTIRYYRTFQKSGEPRPAARRLLIMSVNSTISRSGESAASWAGLARYCDTVGAAAPMSRP